MEKAFKFIDPGQNIWKLSADRSGASFLNDFARTFDLEEFSGTAGRMIQFTADEKQFNTEIDRFKGKIIGNDYIQLHIYSPDEIQCNFFPVLKHPITFTDISIETNDKRVSDNEIKRIRVTRVFISLCLLGGIRFGIPVHGAMLGYDGKGILITGRSEVGKSTCANRATGRFKAYSDDISLITQQSGEEFSINPVPASRDIFSNEPFTVSLPLNAVYYLVQSPADYAVRMNRGEALKTLYEAILAMCYYSLATLPEPEKNLLLRKIFAMVANISRMVPVYFLYATNTENFMKTIPEIKKESYLDNSGEK